MDLPIEITPLWQGWGIWNAFKSFFHQVSSWDFSLLKWVLIAIPVIAVLLLIYFEYIDGMYPELMDLEDLAFAEIKFPLPLPIYTNRFIDFDGETIIVAEGGPKLFIDKSSIGTPNANDEYIITGCIRNEICNRIRMNKQNTFRD